MSLEARLALSLMLAPAIVYGLTPVAIRLAARLRFYDVPAGYKGHGAPTPYLGGAVVIIGFVAVAPVLAAGERRSLPVLAGVVVLALVGALDDRRTVGPWQRVLVEGGLATTLWALGLGWTLGLGAVVDLLVTGLWVVAVVNAFNLFDNMDGAASAMASVVGGAVAVLGLVQSDVWLGVTGAALCGACAGFLPHNLARPSARIFLGDGGSMPIGFAIAALVMVGSSSAAPGWRSVIVGLLLVGVPALDTSLVIVSRRRRGVSILTPGRDHLTHRTRARLGTTRSTVAVLSGVQALLATAAIVATQVGAGLLIAVAALYLLGAAAVVAALVAPPRPRAAAASLASAPAAGIRVARIIGRLNIGGPAIQAITLTKLLEPRGYTTLLIRGSEAPHEGSLDDLAAHYGVEPLLVSALRREPHPSDLKALPEIVRALRDFRPHIVHTHLAKAGTLGRAAALVALPGRRPILVHTFHGHSLEGYFSPSKASVFRAIERILGRRCTRLIAVSVEVRDDLVRLGVAPRDRIEVIPLGFDLEPFGVTGAERAARALVVRQQLGVAPDARLVTLVARLVPIKRVDRFLRIASEIARRADVHFAIVGDGELRAALEATPIAPELADRLVWAGFRRDMPDVCFASDVVVLTSDNEGTPVSLIEAQAAGVPVVSTRVGGAASVVRDGETGRLVDVDDEQAFAEAVLGMLAEPAGARAMGLAGQEHVVRAFALDRLVDDVDALYRRLLRERGERA
ncbi:MAG: hypothetical protein QOG94_3048 [Solirubrobacteraceae bacterium]|nr:hypothetical protein [Solirubrobacteraceae bacterium]